MIVFTMLRRKIDSGTGNGKWFYTVTEHDPPTLASSSFPLPSRKGFLIRHREGQALTYALFVAESLLEL